MSPEPAHSQAASPVILKIGGKGGKRRGVWNCRERAEGQGASPSPGRRVRACKGMVRPGPSGRPWPGLRSTEGGSSGLKGGEETTVWAEQGDTVYVSFHTGALEHVLMQQNEFMRTPGWCTFGVTVPLWFPLGAGWERRQQAEQAWEKLLAFQVPCLSQGLSEGQSSWHPHPRAARGARLAGRSGGARRVCDRLSFPSRGRAAEEDNPGRFPSPGLGEEWWVPRNPATEPLPRLQAASLFFQALRALGARVRALRRREQHEGAP